MDVLWLLVIVPVSFIAGFFLAAILASSHESDGEKFWRYQYFTLKEQERSDVIWQTSHNKIILEIASTLNL